MRAEECCSRALEELQSGAFWRDVLAELLASYFLVAAQCALPLGFMPGSGVDRLATGIGMGFVVIGIGWAFGDFSGAHMNPAVTFTLMLRLKVTFVRAILYWCVQCGAAIGAAYTIKELVPASIVSTHNLAVTLPGPEVEAWQAFVFEMLITAMLCFVVHGATNIKRKGTLYINTIPIGFTLALGIIMAFNITGGSMNPARSLGPAVAMMDDVDDVWDDHWVYWAGPMLGALVAAIFYSILNYVSHPYRPQDSPQNSKLDYAYNTGSLIRGSGPARGNLYPANVRY